MGLQEEWDALGAMVGARAGTPSWGSPTCAPGGDGDGGIVPGPYARKMPLISMSSLS